MYNIPQEMIDEFTNKMRAIYNDDSLYEESMHIDMDDVMCEALMKLGFGEGVEIFKHTEKWYA